MVGEVDGMGRRRVGLDDVKVRMLKLSWTRSTTNLVVRETRATSGDDHGNVEAR